jgi:putative phage-type endonuclease
MKSKFHDISQYTEKWVKLRRGRATTSKFAVIMANFGKSFGNPAHEYAMRIALEYVTGQTLDEYTSPDMERGTELEPYARERYEEETMSEVYNGGFYELGFMGASPDGLVGDDGLIEIKCPKWNTHFKQLVKGGYNSSYRWQIQGQLYVTGRKWCDFISYNDEFPESKQVHIFRVHPDQGDFEMIGSRLLDFENLVNEYKKILTT